LPPKLSVIIPTKNEEGAVAGIIEDCRRVLEGVDHEIIVVDASEDNTASEAVRARAKLVKQIGNGGVGEALVQGFYWARGDYIVFLDGDGTYDPLDIPKVVEPLLKDEADFVNGNRFANMEKDAMPFTNMIGNHFLSWVGNVMFQTTIKDSQSGMKGFRRDLLTRIGLLERGFPVVSELIAEASKVNLRIAEVGITYRRRVGKSKLKPTSAGPKILWASLRMLRDYDPLVLFMGIGLTLIVIGFIAAWPVMLEYMAEGTFRFMGRALIALFCWLSGMLSIFTGIIMDALNYSVKRIEAHAKQSSS